MAGMLPTNVYGLKVPAGGVPVPGAPDFPASVSVFSALTGALADRP